ncbi:hypothetical protein J4205_01995 [Candidatus Pacearchaeota archaeon]|nr:hypothetical protein [Candidatus Pacearchaeota archaeon]
MTKETVFYPREEYDLIIRTLNEPDQEIAKMLGIEPSYVTRNPSEVKVYHAVIRENEKVLGEVTITGKINDHSENGKGSSLTYTSLDRNNNERIKRALEDIVSSNKIQVV